MGKRDEGAAPSDDADQLLRLHAVRVAAMLPDKESDADVVLEYVKTIRRFCRGRPAPPAPA
jgi:hypothetical protein